MEPAPGQRCPVHDSTAEIVERAKALIEALHRADALRELHLLTRDQKEGKVAQ